jgi:hypothetical protein
MTRIEKAMAMKCFGKLAEYVVLDPDPNIEEKLKKEFNCDECSSGEYCEKLMTFWKMD